MKPRFWYIAVLCALLGQSISVRTVAQSDSIGAQEALVQRLYEGAAFEQAQAEALRLREMLKANPERLSPLMIRTISRIHEANKDEAGAFKFLNESDSYARRTTRLETKAAMLAAVSAEMIRWKLPEQALSAQSLLIAVKDSLAARQRRIEAAQFNAAIDSLYAEREQAMRQSGRYWVVERDHAFAAAGALALLSFILMYAWNRRSARFRRNWEKREREIELEKARMRDQVAAEGKALEMPAAVTSATEAQAEIHYPHRISPTRHALLIEPNRLVVMYVKSLLSDDFKVDTAADAHEAMQMAVNHLPDLIICDAELNNGVTGIDLARRFKLDERTSFIPVVLLTDKHGAEGRMDAKRAGADLWFNRPVMDNEFNASLRRLLESRKALHEAFNRCVQLYFSPNRQEPDDPFLAETLRLIEQNMGDRDYSAEDIARKMQLNNQLYAKKLKALTNKDAIDLIREMRLEKAKVLLEKGGLQPQIIADMLGFSSPGAFNRAFKSYFGDNTLLLYQQRKGLE